MHSICIQQSTSEEYKKSDAALSIRTGDQTQTRTNDTRM